jgi:hypothetical protein
MKCKIYYGNFRPKEKVEDVLVEEDYKTPYKTYNPHEMCFQCGKYSVEKEFCRKHNMKVEMDFTCWYWK